MALADVEGQENAVKALRAALSKGSVHHAWLFAGPEGVGKELAAIGLAQALLCKEAPGVGCGKCDVCGRVQRRNHPDVQWVMPEQEQIERKLAGRSDFSHTPSKDIRVEQIRALQERLALRPLEGGRRVVIIASAHRMKDPPQNAFLKTLEEPPPGTVIILITSEPERLLPTIRSRCSRAQFAPLKVELIARKVMAERKGKVTEAEANLIARLSAGSLARALEIGTKSLQRRQEIITAFEALDFDDARTLLSFAEQYGGSREDAEDALDILEVWTRDVAVVRSGGTWVVNEDLTELIDQTAAERSFGTLHARHRLIAPMREAMSTYNASPRLQLESMLFALAKESGARK